MARHYEGIAGQHCGIGVSRDAGNASLLAAIKIW